MGAAWAILQPLILMVVFTIVFSYFADIPTGDIPYPVFSYTALLPWTFLATAMTIGIPSLVSNMNLVTKVNMPRTVIPTGAVLASLVDLGVASIIFVLMLIFYQIELSWTVLWIVPILLVQIFLVIGVVYLGSSLNVLYRDIRFVIPLAIQVWLYMSPVVYPVEIVPNRFWYVYFLNPMAGIIDGYRRAILEGLAPRTLPTLEAFVVTCFILITGVVIFRRLEPQFADII